MNASNGDLTVGRADGNVTGKSANGEIRLGQVSSGTVEVKTSNGEIEIGVQAGTAARLDLFTSFGHVRNHMDSADSPEPDRLRGRGQRPHQLRRHRDPPGLTTIEPARHPVPAPAAGGSPERNTA